MFIAVGIGGRDGRMISGSSSDGDELSEILEVYCAQKDHATVMARQMRVATRAAEVESVRDTKAPLRANPTSSRAPL